MVDDTYAKGQNFDLSRLLFQTRHAMYKARDRELARYSITTEQAAVLLFVKTSGYSPTPAEISRWLIRESQTVCNLLRRMEQRGLVRKFADSEKRNRVRVTLTEKGEQAFEKSIIRESYHRVMSVLSLEERKQLWSSLERLRNLALEEIGMEKPPFPKSL